MGIGGARRGWTAVGRSRSQSTARFALATTRWWATAPAARRAGEVHGRTSTRRTSAVPGMLHARVIRPPGLDATLQSVDEMGLAAAFPMCASCGSASSPSSQRRVGGGAASAHRTTGRSDWPGLRAAKHWSAISTGPSSATSRSSVVGMSKPPMARAAKTAHRHLLLAVPESRVAWSILCRRGRPGRRRSRSGPPRRCNARSAWGILSRVFGLPPGKSTRHLPRWVGLVRHQRRRPRNRRRGAALEDAAPTGARAVGRQDEQAWDPKGPQQLLDVRAGLDRRATRRVGDRMWLRRNRRARATAARRGRRRHSPGGRERSGRASQENGDPSYSCRTSASSSTG